MIPPPMEPGSVHALALRGGVWVFALRVTDHGLVFLARLLVARWLGPGELGLYGVALLVVTIVETMTEPGLNSALIHRRTFDDHDLRTVWTVGCVRGLALGAGAAAAAPLIAGLFGTPDAVPLIRGMALVIVLHGLVSPGLVVLERDLAFRVIALLGLVRAAVLFVATILLSALLGSIEAIVIASVISECIYAAATYLVRPMRVRPTLDLAVLRELTRYGRWITGSSIAVFLLLYLDDIAVGTMLGAAALGTYQIAYQIAALPATEISLMLNRITFSSFVQLRNDRSALGFAFLRGFEVTAALAVPMSAFVAFEADRIVHAFLGDSWNAAIGPLRILAIWGCVRALGAVTTPLLRAVGEPKVVAGFHWAMLIGSAAALIPAIELWGLNGAAWAILVPCSLVQLVRYPVVVRPIRRRTIDLARCVLPASLATGIMIVALAVARSFDVAVIGGSGVGLALDLVIGGAAYLMALAAVERVGAGATMSISRRVLLRAVGRS